MFGDKCESLAWVTSHHLTSSFSNGCYAMRSSPSVSFLATVSKGSQAVILTQNLGQAAMRSKAAPHFLAWRTSAVGHKRTFSQETKRSRADFAI